MRVPLSFLAEYVDLVPGTTPEDVHAALVRVGFEEEAIHRFGVSGPVVVAQVLDFVEEPQSNGKTIRWCQLDVGQAGVAAGGERVRGIVCGANNFAPGDKVVVTLPGAVLPGPFPIAARKTYGHVSDGMIASARELGLGDDHSGIVVLARLGLNPEVGSDAITLLGLDDTAVEVNVTPDRGYALSVRGIAREYSHATGVSFRDPAQQVLGAQGAQQVLGAAQNSNGAGLPIAVDSTVFPVVIRDEAPIRGRVGCEVFVTRVVEGLDPSRVTPPWMVARLVLAGMRSVSLPVDITNYVMLEMGQPTHAYDLDKLTGGITVRRAGAGETIRTLDDKTRQLSPEDLLISDDVGPLGIAGVMGGGDSEVDENTTRVLVEAANFDPVTVARSARRHKLSSEAARRFERGVDPMVAPAAAERVVQLLEKLAGGKRSGVGSTLLEVSAPASIALPQGFTQALVGVDYPESEIESTLIAIGATVSRGVGGYQVTPPTWRGDLVDAWSLAEEVARIGGFERIPSVLPVAPPGRGFTRSQRLRRQAADALAASGLTEVLSFPFVTAEQNNIFGTPVSSVEMPVSSSEGDAAGARAETLSVPDFGSRATGNEAVDLPVSAVKLVNALDANNSFMRTSLLPGLIEAASRNISRGLNDLALYELGLVFRPESGVSYGSATLPPGAVCPDDTTLAALNASIPPQPRYAAGLFLGERYPKQPGQGVSPVGLADALAAVRTLALAVGAEVECAQGFHRALHPGRTAELFVLGGRRRLSVGFVGELLPAVSEQASLPRVVAVFELNLDALLASTGEIRHIRPISAYPAATQDLSLVVANEVPAAQVLAAVVAGAGPLLEHAQLTTDYRGQGMPTGHKSLTFALRFRSSDRTLTAAEATEAKLAGAAAAYASCGATVRE